MSASLILVSTEIGPTEGNIGLIAFTTSASHTSVAATATLAKALSTGDFVTFHSDQALYLRFSTVNTNAVDETAASGVTACGLLKANEYVRWRIPAGSTYLSLKGAVNGTLRFWISSSMKMG